MIVNVGHWPPFNFASWSEVVFLMPVACQIEQLLLPLCCVLAQISVHEYHLALGMKHVKM